MNKETNVTDISHKLNLARKNRQKEDGVLYSEGFAADRSSEDVPTHIEVYEGNYYLAGNAGLSVTIDSASTLIMLTSKEAIELGEALFQAACRGRRRSVNITSAINKLTPLSVRDYSFGQVLITLMQSGTPLPKECGFFTSIVFGRVCEEYNTCKGNYSAYLC